MSRFSPKLKAGRVYLQQCIREGKPEDNPDIFQEEIQKEINDLVLEDIQEHNPSATYESVFGEKK